MATRSTGKTANEDVEAGTELQSCRMGDLRQKR